MGDADVDVVLRLIKDPNGTILETAFDGQGCRGGGPPPKNYHQAQEFLRQLPEWARQAEETAFIVDIFSHAAQAHEHPLRGVCECCCPSRKSQTRAPP